MGKRCPSCAVNFSNRFELCALCFQPLQPVALEEPKAWVVVAVSRNTVDAEILGGLLSAGEIPWVSQKRGVSMYPTPEGGLDSVLLLVPSEFVEPAEELLSGTGSAEAFGEEP